MRLVALSQATLEEPALAFSASAGVTCLHFSKHRAPVAARSLIPEAVLNEQTGILPSAVNPLLWMKSGYIATHAQSPSGWIEVGGPIIQER